MGEASPIQLQVQFLREARASDPPGPLSGFAMTLEHETPLPETRPDGAIANWRKEDVARAIAVAEEAGLRCYRVEIAPDGTISIIVGAPTDPAVAAAA